MLAFAAAFCAGCAGTAMEPATPEAMERRVFLDVGLVEVDSDLSRIAPAARPLAQAALLDVQGRLRAVGTSGRARFAVRDARFHEQQWDDGDSISPAFRFEAVLVFAIELEAEGRPRLAPTVGETRSTILMVGRSSPAERDWVFQQITHGAMTKMDRLLADLLVSWAPVPPAR